MGLRRSWCQTKDIKLFVFKEPLRLQKIRPRNIDTAAYRKSTRDFAHRDVAGGLHPARVYVDSSITVPACGEHSEPGEAGTVSSQVYEGLD